MWEGNLSDLPKVLRRRFWVSSDTNESKTDVVINIYIHILVNNYRYKKKFSG